MSVSESRPEPPDAIVKDAPARPKIIDSAALPFWLLALVALAITIGTFISASRQKGHAITVKFPAGHGIKAGDAVRHRGIDVGSVTKVSLNETFDQVEVGIELESDAAGIATEGVRFWIARPQVSLTNVSGLDTVVGAKYIGVWPGPPDGQPLREFVGDESPPMVSGEDDVRIAIRFANGYGIEAGSAVRHLGIVVGEVTHVDLGDELDGVEVNVRLARNGKRFAKAGTQFWVERPKVSFSGVSGLETIVGGRYIAARPPALDADDCFEFEGMDLAPVTMAAHEDGIEFTLHAAKRQSLERGSPVTYRGLNVGRILSVGLSADSRRVEARIFVRAPFTDLLRTNTKFWSNGGVDLTVGLTGINLNLDTLATVAAGGVAFATPEPPGDVIHTGHRFALEQEAPGNWQDWRPRIAVGSPLLRTGGPLPRLQRASLTWKEQRLGLPRRKRRSGWLLPLDDGRWVVPGALVRVPSEASKDSVMLEVAGMRIAVNGSLPDSSTERVVVLQFEDDEVTVERWPASSVRIATAPEELILFTGPQEPQLVVPADKVGGSQQSWLVDASIPLDEDWNGAAAIARSDAQLIGMLCVEDNRAWIVPLVPLLEEFTRSASTTLLQR